LYLGAFLGDAEGRDLGGGYVGLSRSAGLLAAAGRGGIVEGGEADLLDERLDRVRGG